MAHYAHRYLVRHDLPVDGLDVCADHEMTDSPARVHRIRVVIHLPDGIPEQRRRGLLAVASHCTVHNTLAEPPAVLIELADEDERPLSGDLRP